jgi:hypothetical protein
VPKEDLSSSVSLMICDDGDPAIWLSDGVKPKTLVDV